MHYTFSHRMIIWAGILFTIALAFTYVGRIWVYQDKLAHDVMLRCQEAGYTYGECWNSVNGEKSFSK